MVQFVTNSKRESIENNLQEVRLVDHSNGVSLRVGGNNVLTLRNDGYLQLLPGINNKDTGIKTGPTGTILIVPQHQVEKTEQPEGVKYLLLVQVRKVEKGVIEKTEYEGLLGNFTARTIAVGRAKKMTILSMDKEPETEDSVEE